MMPTCWSGEEPHEVDTAEWNERERSCNQCLLFEQLEFEMDQAELDGQVARTRNAAP